jgi:hypothetical protein
LSEMISTARRVGQSARKDGPAVFCMKIEGTRWYPTAP